MWVSITDEVIAAIDPKKVEILQRYVPCVLNYFIKRGPITVPLWRP